MKKSYIQLSNFGKFMWAGILLSELASLYLYQFLIVFLIFFGLSFSNKVYCNYEVKEINENDIISVKGRLMRAEYIAIIITCLIGFIILAHVSSFLTQHAIMTGGVIGVIFFIFFVVFSASIRRAQDCGFNSWIPLIPGAMLILLFIPSEKADNIYGPYKKESQKKTDKISTGKKIFIICSVCMIVFGFFALYSYRSQVKIHKNAYNSYKQATINSFKEQNRSIKDVNFLPSEDINYVVDNLSSSNKQFLANNKYQITEASKVYQALTSLTGIIDFCAPYYPVNKLKKEYDNYFSAPKKRAEKILLQAIGRNGLNVMKKNFFINKKILFEEIEQDYTYMKEDMKKEGIINLTKKQYCQFIDENASAAASNVAQEFKTLFPNF